MAQFPRYAIYYAPAQGSSLDQFCTEMLGYDAWIGAMLPFPEGIADKVTDSVFRMEEEGGFQDWVIGATIHESAPRAMDSMQAQQSEAIANSQRSDKKPEPIRNRGEKVGRNDPCPCGSGKKYKNCHMRQAAV